MARKFNGQRILSQEQRQSQKMVVILISVTVSHSCFIRLAGS